MENGDGVSGRKAGWRVGKAFLEGEEGDSLALGGRDVTDGRSSGRQRLAGEELGMFLEGSAWSVAAPDEAWHCPIWPAGSNIGAHVMPSPLAIIACYSWPCSLPHTAPDILSSSLALIRPSPATRHPPPRTVSSPQAHLGRASRAGMRPCSGPGTQCAVGQRKKHRGGQQSVWDVLAELLLLVASAQPQNVKDSQMSLASSSSL